jgi:hypothetical protein
MTEATPDGQLHTLGLLEMLRADCRDLHGTSSQLSQRIERLLRQLADPMLPDIPFNLPFRVELWDRHSSNIRWVVSASTNVNIAVGAFEATVACYPPYERFTLRQGAIAGDGKSYATATSTRTVIIEAPSIVPTDDASTTAATSTTPTQ